MKFKKNIFFVICSVLFISCSTTKILYKSDILIQLNRIGIADLNKVAPQIDSLFPKLDSVFNTASINFSNKYLAKETVHLKEKLNYSRSDSLEIRSLCKDQNLDAIILSFVKFTLVINTIYLIPTDKHFECILYTKIYDKNGSLIYHVVHDSKDDTYDKVPTTERVVGLSAGWSYKKISDIRKK